MRKIIKTFVRTFDLLKEMCAEVGYYVSYFLRTNLYAMGAMLELSTPYILWYIVVNEYERRGYFAVGGEVFIPLFFFFVSSVLKRLANKSGKGNEIPVAKKRYTMEQEYGEVTILEEDIQEIILYLNDVENYIEKRGLQKWDS